MIAASIISSAETLGPIPVPVVVRLQGTNSKEGLRLVSSFRNMHIGSATRPDIIVARGSRSRLAR